MRALGEIGPGSAAAVSDIAAALSDRDENVRRESAQALGKIGPESRPAIPALMAALGDDSDTVKWLAVWALGRIGGKAVPPLIALLDDEKLQDTAVVALGDIGAAARPAVHSLVELLQKPGLSTDRASDVVLALSRIGPAAEEAAPTLLKILADEKSDLRPYAAWALAQIGAKDEVPQLIRALFAERDPGSELSIVIFIAVLTLDPEKEAYFRLALKGVTELLANESSLVRQEAATALGAVGKKAATAVPKLAAGLDDPDPEVRSALLSALAAIGPEAAEALPAVIKSLADPAYPVRYSASFAVGKIGPAAKVTAPVLEQNLQDQDPVLRFASAWALVQVDPQRSNLATLCLEPLRWGLKSADSRIRKEAAQALGALGPEAASSVSDLETVGKDDDNVHKSAKLDAAQEYRPAESELARILRARPREPWRRDEIACGCIRCLTRRLPAWGTRFDPGSGRVSTSSTPAWLESTNGNRRSAPGSASIAKVRGLAPVRSTVNWTWAAGAVRCTEFPSASKTWSTWPVGRPQPEPRG